MITMSSQDLAWIKAQSIYRQGDSADLASVKAVEFGYVLGTENYAAFIAGFEEMVINETILM